MTKKRKNKTHEFNVKISEDERAMLGQLAKDANVTMAEILRSAISSRFRMRFANEPHCTTGNNCLCPNMHTIQQADRPTDSELLEKVQNDNAA